MKERPTWISISGDVSDTDKCDLASSRSGEEADLELVANKQNVTKSIAKPSDNEEIDVDDTDRRGVGESAAQSRTSSPDTGVATGQHQNNAVRPGAYRVTPRNPPTPSPPPANNIMAANTNGSVAAMADLLGIPMVEAEPVNTELETAKQSEGGKRTLVTMMSSKQRLSA